MRWLIFFPAYFFGAVTFLLAFLIVCRLTRIPARLRLVANLAAATSLAALVVPIALGWTSRADFTLVRVLALAAISLGLAAIDRILARGLSHPLDAEMQQL